MRNDEDKIKKKIDEIESIIKNKRKEFIRLREKKGKELKQLYRDLNRKYRHMDILNEEIDDLYTQLIDMYQKIAEYE